MNIIQARQDKRRNQIEQIKASIKKAMENDKEISYSDIVMAVMSNCNLSRRTTEEYVDIGLYELKISKEELRSRLSSDAKQQVLKLQNV